MVKCEYPAVENGTIVSGHGHKFYYKATVVFKCNEGFDLHGNNIVVCGENSTWEPELPKCIKGKNTVFLLLLFFISFTLNIKNARKPEEKQCWYLTVVVFISVIVVRLQIHKKSAVAIFCLCRVLAFHVHNTGM